MWLVLCQDGDVEAHWLAAELRARAGRRVELVEAGELVHDCSWEHRVGTDGVSSRLVTGSRVIDSDLVEGVVNRLIWLDAEGFEGASAPDRQYAGAELFALGLSWLESLGGRVLNRPAGISLGGAWRTPGQWRALARAVGLPVVPFDSDHSDCGENDRTVLIVDGQVIEPSRPAGLCPESLAELARAGGLDIMEVGLADTGDVRDVTFLPPLRQYGQACAEAVQAALTRRAAPALAGVR